MKVIVEGLGEKNLDQRMFRAKGGEGSIYVTGGVAYKLCEPGKAIPAAKIRELSVLTDPRIIKPERMLFNGSNQPIGYTMTAVKAPWTPCHLFTRGFLSDNRLTHKHVAEFSLKLREIVDHAHSKKMLLVDLNELNFLLGPAGEVFAIDVNSWQTPSFPATAIMDSIRDRKHDSFSTGTDWFSWGVVTFQMFIGMHPFGGSHPSYKGSVVERRDTRMRDCVSVYHDSAKMLAATDSLDVIPRGLNDWYRATFESSTREQPPTLFDAPAPTQVKMKVTVAQSGGSLKLDEVLHCKSAIARVFTQDGHMAVMLTGKQVVIEGSTYDLSSPQDYLHRDPVAGWMAVTQSSPQQLVKFGEAKGRAIASYDSLFVAACGGLFGSLGSKLMSIGPIGDVHVSNILDLPGAVFNGDGFMMQNLMGRWHILFQRTIRECVVKPIPEFDGFKPIKGAMRKQLLVVSGEKNGEYIRYELQFGPDGSYQLREFKNVSGTDFTFAVNDAGVCVLIDADDEVSAFKAAPGSHSRQVLTGSALDGSFTLWACGEKILASKGSVLYHVSKR